MIYFKISFQLLVQILDPVLKRPVPQLGPSQLPGLEKLSSPSFRLGNKDNWPEISGKILNSYFSVSISFRSLSDFGDWEVDCYEACDDGVGTMRETIACCKSFCNVRWDDRRSDDRLLQRSFAM